MKIALISDTHGAWQRVSQAVKEEGVDYLIFLGDVAEDGRQIAGDTGVPASVLKGNCDPSDPAPAELTLTLGGVRFLLCHGDRYHVKETLQMLHYRAQEQGAEIACFGHSHVPMYEEYSGVTLINPGSAFMPRNFDDAPSWGLLTIDDAAEADGKKVKKYVKKCLPKA